MKKIAFAKPYIGKEELKAVTKVLKSGWLTMGEETVTFEKEFADYVGSKNSVAVNSCTSALFLALKAIGVGPGDEVIVPSFTFAATANVVIHCGATVVFADVKSDDFTLDPKDVLKKITPKTKAIIPVHYGGNLAETDYPITVIEDSAHRIAKNYHSKNIVCYSFYATKNLTTGEGGMLTTEDEKIAIWVRKALLHGLSRDAWKRYNPGSKWYYEVEFSGYKMNTIDLLATMGRVQLSKLDEMEDMRKKIVATYNEILGFKSKGTHLYPILVERRDDFMEYMQNKGISCSFHFVPLHTSPAFAMFDIPKLPVTEYIGSRVAVLPLFPALSISDVKYVCQAIKKFGKFKEGEYGLPVLV